MSNFKKYVNSLFNAYAYFYIDEDVRNTIYDKLFGYVVCLRDSGEIFIDEYIYLMGIINAFRNYEG